MDAIRTPWEIVRPEQTTEIHVYGYVENVFDDRGNYVPRWMGWRKLVGIPYDIPVPGYGTNTVNFLRLWESRASEEFDFEAFTAVVTRKPARKNHSETISKVLYPMTRPRAEKSFVCSSSIFSLPVRSRTSSVAFAGRTPTGKLPRRFIQLNDTHPANFAVVEVHAHFT